MRRRWFRVLAVVLVLGIAAGAWVRLLAGGPVAIVPGGWLRGDRVPGPVEDWSFARRWQYVDVESRAGLLPYSRTTWFMIHDGGFYLLLPSLFGDGLHRRLLDDPRVRVRLDGRIYEQLAKPYEPEDPGPLLAPLLRRTMAVEIDGPVRPVDEPLGSEMWIYRLENPVER